jgi:hypothetical protein
MTALPTVGGDPGAWGTELNAFLQVAHNSDGTLKSGLTPTSVQTANYTATAFQLVSCDISSGSFTVTLPSAPASGTLVGVEVVAVSGVGVNKLTIAAGGTDVFDKSGGSTTTDLTINHQSLFLCYSGGVWLRVAGRDSYLEVAQNRYGAYFLDQYTGTDDQKMTLALAAVLAAGSGTIVFSPRAHTFANQWTTSYVSASVTMGLKIQGAGIAFNGAWGVPSAATTVTFTYSGAGAACMDFQHNGTIEITGIQFKSANVGVPLFQTTNATPDVHQNVFSGGATGTACITDAIVLGGTTITVGAGDTDKYNAYQGRIYGNFFDGIRRAVLFNVATNSVHVSENMISASCGTNLPFGACFDLIGISSRTINDVQIIGNCIEVSSYPFGIKATYAQQCTFGPNGFYDPTSVHLAPVCLLSNANYNRVISGFHADTTPFCIDYPGTSKVENLHQSQHSVIREPVLNASPVASIYLDANGTSQRGYDGNGNYAAFGPTGDAAGSGGYATVGIVSGNCTQTLDGATVNGSNWVTSLLANFTSTDQWFPVSATGIPSAAYILNTATPTTAWPWQASYAYSLGDIARPTTANTHLYQCTTAGTSGSTAPTWPTAGGTVTDGTAVWTDLGTAATAALISAPATATGTGLTLRWGRLGQAQRTLIQFGRFHIVSLGATPVCTADAGAGTSPTGISVVGTDHKFTANITSGTTPATGAMFHVAPAQGWNSAPVFAMTAGNAAAAALVAGGYWLTVSSGTVTANFVNAPVASTAYIFGFVAMG